jgi:hypothetical protein
MLKQNLNDGNTTSDNGVGEVPVIHPEIEINPTSVKKLGDSAFLDVIRTSLEITTPEQFCTCLQGDFQHIFPHGMMACAIHEIENLGCRVQELIASNFPNEYVESLKKAGGLTISPLIAEWRRTKQPVLFELPEHHENLSWLENFKRYDLQNVAAHGLCDIQSNTASYFSFSQIPGKL